MSETIPYERLWLHVTAQYHGGRFSIHGPDHWKRVERNGLLLGGHHGADLTVIRLFALFHDSRRINEGHDPGHGSRGAAFAASLRGEWFDLPDDQFALLCEACEHHTDGLHHDNITIGACWDADRLDLGRVGMTPHRDYMSTALGREIARIGSVEWYLSQQPKQERTACQPQPE